MYSTFHPRAAEYTFISSAHGTLSRIDHMLSHKRVLRNFKKIEIMLCISSDHNRIKLEINKRNYIIHGDWIIQFWINNASLR